MQHLQQLRVELEERLTSGTDHEAPARLGRRPGGSYRSRQLPGRREPSSTGPVRADEIGITKLAGGLVAVLLPPGPQVAAGKAAEHRGSPGVGPFALEGVEDLFDGVGHRNRER